MSKLNVFSLSDPPCHYLVEPAKLVKGNILVSKTRPEGHDLVLVAIKQEFTDSLLYEELGLQGGEHVRHAPLHEEAPPGELGRRHHGNVDGGDDVGEGTHGEVSLKVPELLPAVADSAIWVPSNVDLPLGLPEREYCYQ